jgi:DnaJ-class molecular chaperone
MAHVTCRECPECEGRGVVWQEYFTLPPYPSPGRWHVCDRCGGEGVVADELVAEEVGTE